jgi:hypothetical protein
MYRDPARNPDGLPLHADHETARAHGGKQADRLLLATCNMSRGDGTRTPAFALLVTSREW